MSILAYEDVEGFVAYGPQAGDYTVQMSMRQFRRACQSNCLLTDYGPTAVITTSSAGGLSAQSNSATAPNTPFTPRSPPGSTFTFTMTADSHLDEHTSPDVYGRTLTNIRADRSDFHVDLGNLFMTDKHASRDEAARQYLAQRYYLGQIGPSAPILLALSTHDGENGKYDDGSADCLAVWSCLMRKRYFPNPISDDFYTGNIAPVPHCGLPQNYYAWQWGDALFVVLDPFRYSQRQHGGGDGWAWSLGASQYRWLSQTFEQSQARFKFVFIHNLLCGDQAARGGVEVAAFNEWGGKNSDGSDGFKQHRPGWDMPVHQLLVRNHVAAVFKAHNNFFARQELDGVVYQMVPQPSFAGNDRIRDLENYGYRQGTFIGNSGHVRVAVAPDKVTVDYIHSWLPKDETKQHRTRKLRATIPFQPLPHRRATKQSKKEP